MKKTRILAMLAILILALGLCACGKEGAAETTAAAETQVQETLAPLNINDWSLTASTWSSPNGATVHLSVTPSREALSASFVVRLEGEEAARIPCEWKDGKYTASADLNAANGYCYYVVVTDLDGTAFEAGLNTPTDIRDETLINMEDALQSYCTVTVESSSVTEDALTLTGGYVQVQAPKIRNDGQEITCQEAVLTLSFNGEKIAKEELILQETDVIGGYELTLTDVSFKLPQMEADQQLSLQLDVTLSNGQTLTAPGGVWYYADAGLMGAVG